MKRARNGVENNRGQATVELGLMLAVSVLFIGLVMQAFKSNELFASLVSGPWQSLAGLIQNGSLGPTSSTMSKHPNNFSRVSSPAPPAVP